MDPEIIDYLSIELNDSTTNGVDDPFPNGFWNNDHFLFPVTDTAP